jgi:hypothetical protein
LVSQSTGLLGTTGKNLSEKLYFGDGRYFGHGGRTPPLLRQPQRSSLDLDDLTPSLAREGWQAARSRGSMSKGKSDDDGAPKVGYISGRRRRQTTPLETARIQGIFRSAAAKLEWANRHIAELERQSSDYLNEHWHFRLRTSAPLGTPVLYFDAPHRFPLRFGLMVGDAANNMRSTLDHIVWEVVSPHVKKEQLQKIQYPFAGKNTIRKEIERRFVDKAGDAAVKIIEDHASQIEGLDLLNNGDKHRLIPKLSQVADIRGFFTGRPPPNDYVAANELKMGPDHLLSLSVSWSDIRVDGNGAVDESKIDKTIQLIFGADGPFSGQPVVPTLKRLAESSEAIVADFCKAFPSVLSPFYFEGSEDPL